MHLKEQREDELLKTGEKWWQNICNQRESEME